MATAVHKITLSSSRDIPFNKLVLSQSNVRRVKAGVSINPATPVSLLEPVLADLDLVLLMSVNPGFGGQKFIPGAIKKIMQLDAMRMEMNPEMVIAVDGGVTEENAAMIVDAGADALIAGTAFFRAPDPVAAAKKLKGLE